MTKSQEILQQRIEDKFEELGERMKQYAFSNTVHDWHACINMLPQIADLVKTNLNRALHYYSMMTPKIEAGKANKQEMDAYELLGYYLNERAPKAQNVAYGGRIDKALTGRSRDI